MFWIIDEFSRVRLAIRVVRKLKATDVIEALCELFVSPGTPAHIRSDNGRSTPACGRRRRAPARVIGQKTGTHSTGSVQKSAARVLSHRGDRLHLNPELLTQQLVDEQ